MSVFGPRIGSWDVEQAVIATLTQRLPTYVDRCARLKGIDPDATGFPIRPKSPIRSTKDFRAWPEDRVPFVQVRSPGMADRPIRDAEGYRAFWQIDVFVIVSARDHAATRLMRSAWEDAIPWCLLQNRSLGGFATAVDQIGEGAIDDLPPADERTLQGTACVFVVEVADVLDPTAGPAVFIPDTGAPPATYPDDPAATTVRVDYTPKELS